MAAVWTVKKLICSKQQNKHKHKTFYLHKSLNYKSICSYVAKYFEDSQNTLNNSWLSLINTTNEAYYLIAGAKEQCLHTQPNKKYYSLRNIHHPRPIVPRMINALTSDAWSSPHNWHPISQWSFSSIGVPVFLLWNLMASTKLGLVQSNPPPKKKNIYIYIYTYISAYKVLTSIPSWSILFQIKNKTFEVNNEDKRSG